MKSEKISVMLLVVLGLFCLRVGVSEAVPMGTTFTYQGRLIDANEAADGEYDLEFTLYDANTDGNQIGWAASKAGVDVVDGYFTVELFLGSASFDGDARWLEIGVRQDILGPFTILSPRQEVTPTPYALYAQTAGMDSDWMLSGNDMYSIPTGNLGIGTPSPTSKLDVKAAADGSYVVQWLNQAGIVAGSLLSASGSPSGAGGLILNDGTGVTKVLISGYSENSYISSGGNFGIGTTIPEDKLYVRGETMRLYHPTNSWGHGTELHLGDSNYVWIGEPADDYLELHGSSGIWLTGGNVGIGDTAPDGAFEVNPDGTEDNGDEFVVKSDGKVGIGETNPGWKLDVEGEDGVRALATSGGAAHFVTGSGNMSECLYVQSWAGVGDMIVCRRGSLFPDAEFRVTGNGNVQADGTYTSPCADFAELVEPDGEFEAGDVLVIGSEGKFSLSSEPGSTLVAGIYSTKPAFIGGSSIDTEDNAGKIPMAVMGIVPCKVSVENGRISAGDLLVTSSKPGYAMRSDDPRAGTIVAKALESADADGLINVLVTLQ